jgi:hypothetical protein
MTPKDNAAIIYDGMFEFLDKVLKIGREINQIDYDTYRKFMEEGKTVRASCSRGDFSSLGKYVEDVVNTSLLPAGVLCTLEPRHFELYNEKTGITVRCPRENPTF